MLVDRVIKLARQGYTDAQIIKQLRQEGYSPREINDAFNQAKVKLELNKELEVPRPQGEAETFETEVSEEMEPSIASEENYDYGQYEAETTEQIEQTLVPRAETNFFYRYPKSSAAEFEELISEIIEEKWQEFRKKTSNLFEAVEKIENAFKNFEKKLARNEIIMKKLSDAAKQKFSEQSQEIKMLKAEVAAISETLNKIMKPLVSKVKEQAGMLETDTKKIQEKNKEKEKKEEKSKKKEKKTLDTLFM